jgi:hypothetical protein
MEVTGMTFSDPYRTIIVEPIEVPGRPEREQPQPTEDPKPAPDRTEPAPKRAPAEAPSRGASASK